MNRPSSAYRAERMFAKIYCKWVGFYPFRGPDASLTRQPSYQEPRRDTTRTKVVSLSELTSIGQTFRISSDIWSGSLINQYSFAAGEFASDQGTDDRHTDDGSGYSDSSSPAIIVTSVIRISGDGDRNSGEHTGASTKALIKPLFIGVRTKRSEERRVG